MEHSHESSSDEDDRGDKTSLMNNGSSSSKSAESSGNIFLPKLCPNKCLNISFVINNHSNVIDFDETNSKNIKTSKKHSTLWYLHAFGLVSYISWIGVGASNMNEGCDDTQLPMMLVGYGIFSLTSLMVIFAFFRTPESGHEKYNTFVAIGIMTFLLVLIIQFGVNVTASVWFMEAPKDVCSAWFISFGKTVTTCEYFMMAYRIIYGGFHLCKIDGKHQNLLVNYV